MSCVCKLYYIQAFNEQHSPSKTFGCFSCSFINIGGNASNFDSLAVTLAKLNHTFDVIAIAETNVVAENKDLYLLDGYTSLYQNKIPGKRKGRYPKRNLLNMAPPRKRLRPIVISFIH